MKAQIKSSDLKIGLQYGLQMIQMALFSYLVPDSLSLKAMTVLNSQSRTKEVTANLSKPLPANQGLIFVTRH